MAFACVAAGYLALALWLARRSNQIGAAEFEKGTQAAEAPLS